MCTSLQYWYRANTTRHTSSTYMHMYVSALCPLSIPSSPLPSPPLPSPPFPPSAGEHLCAEMDNLRAKLRYLSKAHDALQTDISVTKRATEKADVDMTQAQIDKEKQVSAIHTHTCTIYTRCTHVCKSCDCHVTLCHDGAWNI